MRYRYAHLAYAVILGLGFTVPADHGLADEFDDPLRDAIDQTKPAVRAPVSAPARQRTRVARPGPAAVTGTADTATSNDAPQCKALREVMEAQVAAGVTPPPALREVYDAQCASRAAPAPAQPAAFVEPSNCGRLRERLARLEARGQSGHPRVVQLRGMIAERCAPPEAQTANAPAGQASPPPEPEAPAPPPRELSAWERWEQQEWNASATDFKLTTSADWTATGNSGFRYCVNVENPTGARLTSGAISFKTKDGTETRLPLRFWDKGVGPLSSAEGCVVAGRDAADAASIIAALDGGKGADVALQPGVYEPKLAKVERQKELSDWLSRAMQ